MNAIKSFKVKEADERFLLERRPMQTCLEVLRSDQNRHFAGRKKIFFLPVRGKVVAGFPSPEEEELRDILSFDEYLITNPDASLILQAFGDSMIGEGIMPGDLVIIEKGLTPQNGDIVVAEADGEWTMKYFRKKGKRIYLEAANPECPPIYPQTELRIGGVVTAVVRKYRR